MEQDLLSQYILSANSFLRDRNFNSMKKNLLSNHKVYYLPCRLVRGTHRWYFVWYQTNPADGIRKREQRTYDINRIKNKRERLIRAKEICNEINEINEKLPSGWPYRAKTTAEKVSRLCDAVEFAHSLKIRDSKRKRTHQMYNSVRNVFLGFLRKQRYDKIDVKTFTKGLAMEFMDEVLQDELNAMSVRNTCGIFLLRMSFVHLYV